MSRPTFSGQFENASILLQFYWLSRLDTGKRSHLQSLSPMGDAGNTIVENNGGLPSGQVPKQRTSTGGKEDTENSSMGSPHEAFEGFDS